MIDAQCPTCGNFHVTEPWKKVFCSCGNFGAWQDIPFTDNNGNEDYYEELVWREL